MTAAVKFNQVVKRYDDLEALKGISFEVEEGAFFGLLGPNGAGKSTLINAMSGLITPTSGSIEVQGFDVIRDYRETRRRLGLVPQELISDPFFSIKELLELQSGYYGIRGKEQKLWINELLERLALTDKMNAITNQLSGGMKRRVLIAMALVHKPRVLVLDEPTAGVDVDLRHTLWEFTKELHQKGHTIILTTHYLEEAEALCEKVAIIQKGEVKALDRTADLLATHPFRYIRISLEEKNAVLNDALASRLVESDASGHLFKMENELTMSDMLGMIHQSGLHIKDVSSRDATLEEVFMNLTGAQS